MAVWGDDRKLEGNYVSVLSRAIVLLAAGGVLCFANIDITVTNPDFGNTAFDNDLGGCATTTPHCVFGNPVYYQIQSFNLQESTGVGGTETWTLTIDTNYGNPENYTGHVISPDGTGNGTTLGVNPIGSGTNYSMPLFCDNGVAYTSPSSCPLYFFMSDFLIVQGNTTYGVVMSAGHGYTADDVYSVGSATGYMDNTVGDPTEGPVVLDPGGTLINKTTAGSMSVTQQMNGSAKCYGADDLGASHDCAIYQITETFSLTAAEAANFFNPSLAFTIYASSADCFNDSLVYNQTVPEPSGLIWLVPVLLLGAYWQRRRSIAAAK